MSSIVSEAQFQAQYHQQLASNEKNDIPSKVLLVCVYNISGRIITHDIFYRLFSEYGEVLKILIFEKAKVWKSFVEMRTLEEALYAKQKLNNHILFNDGSQIKIFYAHIQQIKFCRNLSDGVDYEQLQMLKKALTKKQNSSQMIPENSSSSLDKISNLIDLAIEQSYNFSVPDRTQIVLENAKHVSQNNNNNSESPLYQKSSSTYSTHSTTASSIQSMISKINKNNQPNFVANTSSKNQQNNESNLMKKSQSYFQKDDFKESFESNRKLEVDQDDEDYENDNSSYQVNEQDYADIYESHKHIYDHIHNIIADDSDMDTNSNNEQQLKLPQKQASSQVLLLQQKEYPSSADEQQQGSSSSNNQDNQLQTLQESSSYTASNTLNSISIQNYSQMFLNKNQKKLNFSNSFKRNSEILIDGHNRTNNDNNKQQAKQLQQEACPQKIRMSLDLSLKKLDQILDNITEKDYEEKNIIQASLEDMADEEEEDENRNISNNNSINSEHNENVEKQVEEQENLNNDDEIDISVIEDSSDLQQLQQQDVQQTQQKEVQEVQEVKNNEKEEEIIQEKSDKESEQEQQQICEINKQEKDNGDDTQSQQQQITKQLIETEKQQSQLSQPLQQFQQQQQLPQIDPHFLMMSQPIIKKDNNFIPFNPFLSQVLPPQQPQLQQQHHFQPQLHTQSLPFQPQSFLLQQQKQLQQKQQQLPLQQITNKGPVEDNIQQLAEIYQTYDAEEINPAYYVNPKFLLENKKSQTLYIRGLDINKVTAQQLFNLFSNFGNVKSIMFLKKNNIILMEFQNVNFATQAKDFLNNTYFLGGQMKIFYSNYESLTQKQLNQNSKFTKETFFESDIKQHRFKEDEVLNTQLINPPSQILYISNLAPQVCNMEFITKLFSPYGNIQNIKFQNTNSKKNKCFVKFQNLQDSFNAMANLHSTYFYGRKTYISFTRAKI